MIKIYHNEISIVVFSDTHGMHRKISYTECDVVIHLGDACSNGDEIQLVDFFQWFKGYPAKYRLLVAGNHDLQWELDPEHFLSLVPKNVIFLENRSICLFGITFVSVPCRLGLHAYPDVRIRNPIDFLLTHNAPYGILDNKLGCKILRKFLLNNRPTYHLFGHIHELSGEKIQKFNTKFINVSIYNILAN